ncbi:MAG: hypothetical protein ABIP14_05775 [Blastocatellia bacterium]
MSLLFSPSQEAKTRCYTGKMSEQSNNSNQSQIVFILAGTTGEYTAARQQLKITPRQAFWLTGASRLKGLTSPKVYRVGSWRALPRLKAIEAALAEIKAEIIDLQEVK